MKNIVTKYMISAYKDAFGILSLVRIYIHIYIIHIKIQLYI